MGATTQATGIGALGGVQVGSTGGLAGAESVSNVPSTPSTVTSGANAAGAITITGVAGQRVRLLHLVGGYFNAPASVIAPGLQVTDGVITLLYILPQTIGSFAVPLPPGGLQFAVGATVTVTIVAGGAGVVGTVAAGSVIA